MLSLNFGADVLSCALLNYFWFDFLISMYKTKKGKLIRVVVYILNIAIMVIISMSGNFIEILLGNILLCNITGLLYFNFEKKIINYSQNILFIILLMTCEVIVFFSLNIIISLFNLLSIDQSLYKFFKTIISLTIMLIIYQLLKKIFNKQKKKAFGNISPILMIFLPFFSVLILIIILILERYIELPYIAFLSIFITLGLLFINIYLIKFNEYVYENNKLKYDLDLINKQANIQLKYYEELESKYNWSRLIFHDIKRHIGMIQELYESGNISTGEQYIEKIYEDIDELSLDFKSNNKVFEILINDKIKIAKSYNIEFNCFSSDPNLEFISNLDLVIIFSNLIDNAIEAVNEIKEKRVINFEINNLNSMIVINIQNPFLNIKFKNNKFKSTKKSDRGLGLTNIKLTIEKYNGSIIFNNDNKIFNVTIIIPTPRKKEI